MVDLVHNQVLHSHGQDPYIIDTSHNYSSFIQTSLGTLVGN